MHSTRRGRGWALGAVTGAFLVVVPGAQAAQLIVDDNAAQCPGAGFTTIQSAVTAAATGDTIAVCAGTYTEGTATVGSSALTINKSVNIRGVGADSVTIQPAGDIGVTAPGAGPPLRDTAGNIISVGSAAATAANAVTVNISGVTVRGNDRFVEVGVNYLNATGSIANTRVTGIVQSQATGGQGRFGILQRGQAIGAFSTAATGVFPISITNDEIDGYNKGGIVADSFLPDPDPALPGANSGSRVAATITGSVIRGAGPLQDLTPPVQPQIAQNGIQISAGASGLITQNTISDNRRKPGDAVGVLLFDSNNSGAGTAALTQVHQNNLQNNNYGVINLDATGALDNPVAVDVSNNWWGNPSGPTCDTDPNSTPDQPAKGDFTNCGGVTGEDVFLTAPRSQASAPGTPTDARPTVSVTAPADGATVTPGVAAPVTATAADDLGVVSVTFRKGATVLGTDTTAPYTAAYTPTAAEAGTSQAITATAQDTKGQTAASAISVRVTGGVANVPEDRPPVIAFASPAENALLPATGANLVVNAADDRGVANVRFIDDNQTVCTDNAAPFTCAYKPQGDDVGRNTLIAIATDGAGQTAVAIRTVRVNRFTPRSLSSTTTRRDRRAPYRFTTKGTLGLPAGVTRAQGCGAGNVSVQVKRGSTTLSTRRVTLKSNCTYSSTVTFANRRRLGRAGRLKFTARFTGNTVLGRRTAASDTGRAG